MTAQQREALLKIAEIMKEADIFLWVDGGEFGTETEDDIITILSLGVDEEYYGDDLIKAVEEFVV